MRRQRADPVVTGHEQRAAAAMYVEPAFCCCSAVSRVAVSGEHSGSCASPP
ncbi:hypothetical protein QF032_000317 [Streptomyces achromogenes]|uniref:Uncharacterized protein n=1 Tax=Streptomyces achromogenes TaxID=67255 RepID=A0ABU0PSH0_STRAH|nr:hypothetical protein [Streptomyces achromogenes]MDQ0828473.1 hypothetical protein [Streptomyces achromogenes]